MGQQDRLNEYDTDSFQRIIYNDDGERIELGDMTADENSPVPSTESIKEELTIKLKTALAILDNFEQKIIQGRFFAEPQLTYAELGASLGISRTWAEKKEKQLLVKLNRMVDA